jgi:hypothetical protein
MIDRPPFPKKACANQACPSRDSCAMFPLFQIRTALHYWVETYCEGDHTQCRRWRSMLVGEPPSPCLLPNGRYLKAPVPRALAS